MLFLTFLASLPVMHWIVRKDPGLGQSNQSARPPISSPLENEPALCTSDLACLARSLARESPRHAAPDEVPVKLDSSQHRNAADI